MQIFVKLLKGDSVALDVKPLDLIEDVKKRIEEMIKITAQQQQYSFGAVLLQDGHCLSDYNIQHGSTINVVSCRVRTASLAFFSMISVLKIILHRNLELWARLTF